MHIITLLSKTYLHIHVLLIANHESKIQFSIYNILYV